MATRIVFAGGQETAVSENQEQVVSAVRRDHPNPVKLEGVDGLVLYVNWAHVTVIPPAPSPRSDPPSGVGRRGRPHRMAVALEQNAYRARSDHRWEIGRRPVRLAAGARAGPARGLSATDRAGVRLCPTPGRGVRGRPPSPPRSRR